MTDIAFVRKNEIPASPPPITEMGIIGWMKQNLFSSWWNSFLTLFSLYFITMLVAEILPWAWGGHWNTKSLRECLDLNPNVACFSVLTARWKQLLFGLYPAEEYWRPTLTFFLLILSIIPILFPRFIRFIWFSIIYPGLALWLLWGGSFWSVAIVYIGISFGVVLYFLLSTRLIKSASLGLSLAILLTIMFFLFVAGGMADLLTELLPINLPFVESLKFGGFTLSLIVGVTGIVASFPIGILLALGRQSKNLPLVKMICVGFIEFIRGVPLITLLFVASVLLNYFLPPGTNFDIVLRVIIMVTLFSAAYMAEVIRGGLAGLAIGQHEASASLGLTYWQSQRLIIMPQALKISIPGIVNTFIGLFKDTTLVSIISLRDPVGLASTIRADAKWNGIYWELYIAIGLMFFIFCFGMSKYSQYLEKKLKTDN
ncbi:MAG: amino acid ABC transporter permease [Pseudomonadota bacterium]|nr:amino acid ABC transporter permease [Pseudomonadota bacterium]